VLRIGRMKVCARRAAGAMVVLEIVKCSHDSCFVLLWGTGFGFGHALWPSEKHFGYRSTLGFWIGASARKAERKVRTG